MIKNRIVAVIVACIIIMMTIPSAAFGSSGGVTGQFSEKSEESEETPDTAGEKPEKSEEASDTTSEKSEEGKEVSDTIIEKPEKSEETPDTASEKSEKSEEASVTTIEKPEQNEEASADVSEIPAPQEEGGDEVLETIVQEEIEPEGQHADENEDLLCVDEKMQESKIADSITEEYVKSNVNPVYSKAEKLEIVNILIVKQTLGDASRMSAKDTIHSIMQENKDFMSVIICMLEGVVAVYDLSDESDYYVAYADTMHNDSTSEVRDVIFAHSNDQGEEVKGQYDYETGLAYIPKRAYNLGGKTGIGEVQVQLLQAVQNSGSDVESETIVVTDDEKDITTEVVSDEVYELVTTVETEPDLDTSEILVSINGIPASEEMYEYHSSTGELEVYQSPAMVQSISVQGGEETILSRIRNIFRPLSANAATYNTMEAVSNTKIEISEKLKEGYYFYDEEAMVRYTSASAAANTYIPYGDDVLQGFAEWIVSEKGNIDTGNLVVSAVLNQFQVMLHTLSDKYIDFAELDGVIATLRCSHITLAAGGITNTNHPTVANAWRPNTVGVRVIKINETADKPYIILGMLTQKVNTQNGAGLFKVYIKKNQEAALRIKKVLSSDVTAYIASADMLNDVNYDAKFNIYTDKELTSIAKDADGNPCRRIQAKKNGNTEKIRLAPGTYWIKEMEAPDKLSLNDPVNKPGKCVKKVVLESGEKEVEIVKFSNNFYCTWFRLKKLGDDGRPVVGAVYGIYSDPDCKTIIAKGITGEDGRIGNDQSPWSKYDSENNTWEETAGNMLVDTDYYIKEISSPLAYALDPSVYRVRPTVEGLGKYDVEGANVAYARLNNFLLNITEKHLSVRVKKASANPGITDGNPCYSYAGAAFKIYSDAACKNEVASLITDENGLSSEVTGLGSDHTYYVREYKASEGFRLSDACIPFTLTYKNPIQTVEFPNEPVTDQGILEIYKEDAETGEAIPQGDGSLEGAQFEMNFYAGYYTAISELPAVPTRSWVLQTLHDEKLNAYRMILDDAHKVSGDDFYIDAESGLVCLPLGTVTIQEISGPEGYAVGGKFRYSAKDGQAAYAEDGIFLSQIRSDDDGVYLKLGNQVIDGNIIVEEEVYRGDVELKKMNADTDKPMAGVKFKITSAATGESQVIISDEKGIASTEASHVRHTDRDGVWFGGGEPDDEKGALPYGTYEIQELTDEYTYGKDPFDAVFTIDEETAVSGTPIKLTFKSDGEVVNETVRLKTTALIAETETKNIPMEGDFTVVDIVEYGNLTPGRVYKFVMTPMVKETGEPFLIDDEPVSVTKELFIEEPNGTVEMSFELSAEDVDNETLVMFEKIFYREEEIQHHEDWESEDQSIYKPAIGTSLHDTEGGKELGTIGKSVTLTDTVYFENLYPGVEYQITGKLVLRETGEPFIIDGKEVTSAISFVPQSASGTVNVDYIFDTTGLKNTACVAFEELSEKEIRLAEHADINDCGQTVFFPEIRTSARDANTQTNVAYADKEVTIEDTVSYFNLIPNWEYVVKGVLMDKKTGESAVDADGNVIAAETTFVTPEAEKGKETVDGEVMVTFTFGGVHLAGRTLVAFEALTHDGCEYTVHKDLSDSSQTVHLPEIKTTFKDESTKAHLSHAEDKIKLVDAVRYKNLEPGRTYTLTGILYDRDSKSPLTARQYINDKPEKVREVTVSHTFIPETANGMAELEFVIDASSLAGKSVVAFERLMYSDEEEKKVIASHEDITDKGQTVNFPSMKTTASIQGKKEAVESGEITVVDKVECRGLQKGREVTVTGILMDKSSGRELLINGKKVEASKTFRAKSQDCTVELWFTFDASGLGEKDLVAFEKACDVKSGIQIAEHEDLNDKEQTVRIIKASTASTKSTSAVSGLTSIASAVKTGDVQPVAAMSVLMLLAVAAMSVGIFLKRKSR